MKQHWEDIYNNKQPNEVSWTQEKPSISLDFIHGFNTNKNTPIIDIGGGDSKLVDYLLDEGYTDITVLDISGAAIERAKKRLGNRQQSVKWIVNDILEFEPERNYGIWHDRAAFHFQTDEQSIDKYISIVNKAASQFVVVGTFSVNGPKKCSGIEIKQYEEGSMKARFENEHYKNTTCKYEDHITPSGNVQNFIFCGFKRD